MTRWLERLSLRAKMAAVIGALLALATAIPLVVFPGRMDAFARRGAERRAVGMAVVAAGAVAPGLEFGDVAAVQEILDGVGAAPDVLWAAVRRDDGTVVGAFRPERMPAPKGRAATRQVVTFGEAELGVEVPVEAKGGGKGSLELGLSLSDLAQERAAQQGMMAVTALLTILVGALAVVVGSRVLVRPVVELTRLTRRVLLDGDLTTRVEVRAGGEVGELARTFQELVDKLRAILVTLQGAVGELKRAVGGITDLTSRQRTAVLRQATSATQTQSTAQEIKVMSGRAAEKATQVLEVAARVENLGAQGEKAVEASVRGLEEIRTQFVAMVERTSELLAKASQIGDILATVKDIADQTNILALNAAIEAARAGEVGAGFAVVAREMRQLSDQSLQATRRIGEILGEVEQAARGAGELTDRGAAQMETSVRQVRVSGESLRSLGTVVQETGAAAREIAMAVGQQDTGVSQIFDAVVGLNQTVDDAAIGIQAAQQSVEDLERLAERVSEIVAPFKV